MYEEFALYADICDLGLGFLATDSMSFLQSQGQNTHQTGLVMYIEVQYEYCVICKRNFWFF